MPKTKEIADNPQNEIKDILSILGAMDKKFSILENKVNTIMMPSSDRFKTEIRNEDVDKAKVGREKIPAEIVKIVDEVLGQDFGIEVNNDPSRPGVAVTIIVPERLSDNPLMERPIKMSDGGYAQDGNGKVRYESYKEPDKRTVMMSSLTSWDALNKHCQRVKTNIVTTYQKMSKPLPQFNTPTGV